MSPRAWKILRDETYALRSPHASTGANCDYLTDFLLGYRETVIDPDASSPFSPGSAMDGAWKAGHAAAKLDLKKRSRAKLSLLRR